MFNSLTSLVADAVGELTGYAAPRVHDEDAEKKRVEEDLAKSMAGVDVNRGPGADGSHPHDDAALQEAKSSMWNMAAVKEYIGADVLSLLSVPVFIMEPTTMLQKMSEVLEYTELLDAADAAEDPVERMVMVATFLVAPFGCCERAWKPFNSLLGETFEMEGLGPKKDGRFVAEQVTVTPPVGAAHAESPRWEYDIVSAPRTKFLGNSLEVFPNGRTRIKLRTSGETYTHVPPHVKVHSVVLGRTWIDVEGHFYVYCPETGVRCDLQFTPCGWFNAGRYEFAGHVTDAQGVKRVHLSGLWNAYLDAAECDAEGEPLPNVARRRLWTCSAKPEGDHYGMTYFARDLNTCAGLTRPPLPSDSRRRADREALVGRHLPKAGAEMNRLEDQARAEAAHREAGKGPAFAPRWFEEAAAPQLLEGELDAETVPVWQWKAGGFERLDKMLGPEEGGVKEAEVLGHGYAPWQFPELEVHHQHQHEQH